MSSAAGTTDDAARNDARIQRRFPQRSDKRCNLEDPDIFVPEEVSRTQGDPLRIAAMLDADLKVVRQLGPARDISILPLE